MQEGGPHIHAIHSMFREGMEVELDRLNPDTLDLHIMIQQRMCDVVWTSPHDGKVSLVQARNSILPRHWP